MVTRVNEFLYTFAYKRHINHRTHNHKSTRTTTSAQPQVHNHNYKSIITTTSPPPNRQNQTHIRTHTRTNTHIMSFIRHEVDRSYAYKHGLQTNDFIYYGVILREIRRKKNHISLIASFKSHKVLFPVRDRRI